jgi:quercetin dioxygenase-like cupin family protein
MEISRAVDGSFERGDEGRFTGEAWLRSTLTAGDETNLGVVHFAPNARTHWHRHPGGQFLFGVSGRGRVRSKGDAAHVIEPGDVIHAGPEEWHFHGGAPDAPLVHVAVNGGAPDWGDAVTDDEYGEGF